MDLYSYFRSSASFRVRIALALKGLPYDYRGVHLVRNEQLDAPYAEISPQRLVPLLQDGDATLTQSLAIIEYLDEVHPEPALLPRDPLGRARVRSLALDIACEIHPLNNLRVLKYLVKEMGVSESHKDQWYAHWVRNGLEAFDQQLAHSPDGAFCHGDQPGMADCVLIPQIFNAQRFNVPLDGLTRVQRVADACMALDAFRLTQPSACPDAEG